MILFLLFLIVLIVVYVYLNGKYNEIYWKKRGVKFYTKNKVLGPFWDFLFTDRALFQIFHEIYLKYRNEPAVGIGTFFQPSLYVTDATNVNFVMQSDFASFSERGFEASESDLLADNILFMNGKRWRLMRQNMTPLFTAAKLKNMYYIIDKCALDFVDHMKQTPDKWNKDTFNTLSTFCCAAFGGAVFGISTQSTYDSPFLKVTREAFAPTLWSNIRFSIASFSNRLFNLLNLRLFGEFEDFFIGAIKQVLRQREKENIKRHDFADICLQIQKNGVMKDETGYELKPTDELLAAQAFFFFTAGVEPTATSIFAVLIELGRHPEILKRVQNEIKDIYTKYNGQLSYDAIAEMEYLDKVYNESLRMYPPIGYLTRKCVRDTVLPVGNIKIAKGTKMYTALYALHHDPKFYKNPEVFDPERPLNDHKSDVPFLPFGKGGRICIGERYAKLQAKAALAHLLRCFDVKTKEYKGGLKYGKDQIQVRMKNVDIEFTPRN